MSTRLLGLSLALTLSAAAAHAADDNADLRKRLDEQEQKIKVLERKLELEDEATKGTTASAPVVKAGVNGFSIQSADSANVLRVRGILQFDGRDFLDDATPNTANTWFLRSVRPIVEGTFGNLVDVRFAPDFAQGKTIIQDAYLVARFQPWLQVTAGKFKPPVGLERLQSEGDIRFIERGFPTSLVPNRDIGVSVGGNVAGGVVNYSLGIFNGVADGASSDSNATPDAEIDAKKDIAARIFVQPFLNSDNFALRGFGIGVGGTYVNVDGTAMSTATRVTTNTLLPTYKTPGQQNFFSYRGDNAATATINEATIGHGKRQRLSPQAYYYIGSFGILGEYARVTQDLQRTTAAGTRRQSIDVDAWQLQFAWLATGEEESFRGVNPGEPYRVSKPGWGALELLARIQELTIDDAAFVGGANSFADPAASPRSARAYGIGASWYFNQAFKWALDYDVTRFDGGAPNGGDRPDEKALFTRLQVSF
jgi:phosphate-selective porin OprO/OprP